jgi:hypothetical protein
MVFARAPRRKSPQKSAKAKNNSVHPCVLVPERDTQHFPLPALLGAPLSPSLGSVEALQLVEGCVSAGLFWLGKAVFGDEGLVGTADGLLTPAPGPLVPGAMVPAPGAVPPAVPPPAARAAEPASRLPSMNIERAVLRISCLRCRGRTRDPSNGFQLRGEGAHYLTVRGYAAISMEQT